MRRADSHDAWISRAANPRHDGERDGRRSRPFAGRRHERPRDEADRARRAVRCASPMVAGTWRKRRRAKTHRRRRARPIQALAGRRTTTTGCTRYRIWMRQTACGGSLAIEPCTSRCSAASYRARPAWRSIFVRRCQKAAQPTPSEAPTRSRGWPEASEPASCNERPASWRRRSGVAIDGALVAPVLERTADILQRLVAAIAASLPPEATVARPLGHHRSAGARGRRPAARLAALPGRGRGDRCVRRVAATARCRLWRADRGNWPIAERLPVRGRPRGVARRPGGDMKACSESRILIVDDAEANVDVLVEACCAASTS